MALTLALQKDGIVGMFSHRTLESAGSLGKPVWNISDGVYVCECLCVCVCVCVVCGVCACVCVYVRTRDGRGAGTLDLCGRNKTLPLSTSCG